MGSGVIGKLFRSGKGTFGALVLIVFVLAGALAPRLAPYDPNQQNLMIALQGPSLQGVGGVHLLGTDSLGRDVLSRMIYGARVSLLVGALAVLGSMLIGVIIGAVGGYFRGATDEVLSRLTDTLMSLPFLIVALAVMAILRPNLQNIILVLAITSWAPFARLARSQVLSVRELDYIVASRAIGAGQARVLVRHVVPNIMVPVLVVASLQVGTMILAEAALAFLGVGVQPPLVSWGAMAANGWQYLQSAWWLATFPGMAISLVVVGVNLFGDWFRDTADPLLRQRS